MWVQNCPNSFELTLSEAITSPSWTRTNSVLCASVFGKVLGLILFSDSPNIEPLHWSISMLSGYELNELIFLRVYFPSLAFFTVSKSIFYCIQIYFRYFTIYSSLLDVILFPELYS